jgi:molecular chaperone GrpE
MAEDRRGGSPEGASNPDVKVVDRRRFRADGDPVEREGAGERAPAPAPDEGAPEPPREAGDAQRKLAEQAARIDELTRAYAKLVEDNKSFRARLEREQARVVEAERASVAQALLESADDLERALAAVVGAGEAGGDALQNLAEGVRLSLAALRRRIAELGAERIEVEGRPFDPRVAEAIDAVAVADESQDGLVLQEIRSGYRIGDRVLRPARVRVGRLARA